jgi:hypothetical protein
MIAAVRRAYRTAVFHTQPIMNRNPLLPIALLAAAAALSACGERAPEPCAPAPAAAAGWQGAAAGPVTLRLPPGYVFQSTPTPHSPGEWDASWAAGPSGPPARITLHVAKDVDAADWSPGDSAALNDRRACAATVDGRPGRVTTGWMADPTSAGGRTYVTLAGWPGTKGGPGAALSMAAESPAEAARQRGVAASVRLR